MEKAAQDGLLPADLYALLVAVRKAIKANAQSSEGMHNLIKAETRQSPSMTMPLLDARVRIKIQLGWDPEVMARSQAAS